MGADDTDRRMFLSGACHRRCRMPRSRPEWASFKTKERYPTCPLENDYSHLRFVGDGHRRLNWMRSRTLPTCWLFSFSLSSVSSLLSHSFIFFPRKFIPACWFCFDERGAELVRPFRHLVCIMFCLSVSFVGRRSIIVFLLARGEPIHGGKLCRI